MKTGLIDTVFQRCVDLRYPGYNFLCRVRIDVVFDIFNILEKVVCASIANAQGVVKKTRKRSIILDSGKAKHFGIREPFRSFPQARFSRVPSSPMLIKRIDDVVITKRSPKRKRLI